MTTALKYVKIGHVCISLTDFYESDKEAAMSLLQAILMGIIQGLTEFLPVSSSGHLALFKILFDVNTDTGILYDVLLHVGTLIAISLVYYRDILKLVVDGCCIIRDAGYNVIVFFRNKTGKEQMAYRRVINSSYRKFAMLIIVSTIPTGIIGYFCKDVVEMASEIHLPYRNGSVAFDRGSLQGRRQTSEKRHLHGCVFCRNRTGNRNASGTFTLRYDDYRLPACGLSAQFCREILVFDVDTGDSWRACSRIKGCHRPGGVGNGGCLLCDRYGGRGGCGICLH